MARRTLVFLATMPGSIRLAAQADETTRVINDCERRTDQFKKTLDLALGRNALRLGAGREEQLNRHASNLENLLDRVGDSWNRDHNMNKIRESVSGAIAVTQDVNRTMRNWPSGDDVAREWAAVRTGVEPSRANIRSS